MIGKIKSPQLRGLKISMRGIGPLRVFKLRSFLDYCVYHYATSGRNTQRLLYDLSALVLRMQDNYESDSLTHVKDVYALPSNLLGIMIYFCLEKFRNFSDLYPLHQNNMFYLPCSLSIGEN